jgi:uncharacterized protein YoaH (UPF0181 family)
MAMSPANPPSGGKVRQPWLALGMSRATWYRLGKPSEKPQRVTQKNLAKIMGASVRTIQRDAAQMREEDRKKRVARVHEYMAQGYSQDEACELTAAELRARVIEKLISEGRLVTFAQASQIAAKLPGK